MKLIKLNSMTSKVFIITFLLFLMFFLIIMAIQIFIAGYDLVSQTEGRVSDIMNKAEEYIGAQEDLGDISDINYELKGILWNLRNTYSENNVSCEFLIIDENGSVACSLKNEVVMSSAGNDKNIFVRFENISDLQLLDITLEQYVVHEQSLPLLNISGYKDEELSQKYRKDIYYGYNMYLYNKDGYYRQIVLNEDAQNTTLVSGRYANNFIALKNNNIISIRNMNENRKRLLDAVMNNEYSDNYEKKTLNQAYFYEKSNNNFSLNYSSNERYNLVMSIQINPLEAILYNNIKTYAALTLLTISFSILLASIFSRMIVKPVKKIEDKAKRLSKLDFSSKDDYKYNRSDEIGSLYRSINSLAVNLDSAITELKNKNMELTMDIEKERELDIKRREFVAATSHELKTPLARIRGYAEALEMNLSEEKKSYYYRSLMNEVDIMNELILEMLSLSKLESQSYSDLKIENINLFKITNSVLNRSLKLITDKDITYKIICDNQEMECKGDPAKIERVITNFVDNAVHYTPEGKKIIITLSETEKDVYFEVENYGSNIDEEMMPYIWESFYKGDKARTKNKKSVTAERTGLGLSIIKAILNLHKSEFGVKNTKDGVAFYFRLDK